MSEFLNALRNGAVLADGATGSYLFELTGRLSEPGHIYESLNESNPDLVRGLHLAYLQAGARTVTTNTFDANVTGLERSGLGDKAGEINSSAIQLARESVEQYRKETGSDDPIFIIGSIGPANRFGESPGDIEQNYGAQVDAFIDGDVDAILIETFTSLIEAENLVRLVHGRDKSVPVIVHMALKMWSDGEHWDIDPQEYVRRIAAVSASVVGVNCISPWDALAFIDAVRDLPEVTNGKVLLSAMPNAGGFERIGSRFMSRVNPEFMGQNARALAGSGARLIGGCCEVHPDHIREMAGYLLSRRPRSAEAISTRSMEPVGDDVKRLNGRFSEKVKTGQFAISLEMVPPRGTGPRLLQSKIDFIKELADSGIADAVDITDGSRGIPLMPPGDLIALVRERLGWTEETGDGIEMIPHFASRDLNTMGIQSRLIGYNARRIRNVLYITGDPPKMSPTYPRATPVFDMDSIQMIRLTHEMLNAGVDFGGQPLGRQPDPRTRFTIGTGYEPEALDIESEIAKLRMKLEAGADYVMTQPAFTEAGLSHIERFHEEVPVLIGVMVLTSLAHAHRFAQVPGVHMPESIFERIGRFDDVEDQGKAGLELALEQTRRIKSQGWGGLYLMSPASPKPALEVLKSL